MCKPSPLRRASRCGCWARPPSASCPTRSSSGRSSSRSRPSCYSRAASWSTRRDAIGGPGSRSPLDTPRCCAYGGRVSFLGFVSRSRGFAVRGRRVSCSAASPLWGQASRSSARRTGPGPFPDGLGCVRGDHGGSGPSLSGRPIGAGPSPSRASAIHLPRQRRLASASAGRARGRCTNRETTARSERRGGAQGAGLFLTHSRARRSSGLLAGLTLWTLARLRAALAAALGAATGVAAALRAFRGREWTHALIWRDALALWRAHPLSAAARPPSRVPGLRLRGAEGPLARRPRHRQFRP